MKKTFKKRAFISAIAMLVVSAIVLTSATYAWFSMAKQVSVEAMNLNITSPDGVQISANTSAWTTALTLADLNGTSTTRFVADTDHTNHFPELLTPSSSNLNSAGKLPSFFSGSIGENTLTTTVAATDATGGYVVFDVFLKVAADQKIYWGGTTVTCEDNPEVLTAMRLGMIHCGGSEDKTAVKTLVPANNAGNRVVMYEPDASNHTEASNTATGYVQSYYAIAAHKDTVTTGNIIPSSQTQYVGASVAKSAKNTDTFNTNTFFNALTGINRVRVYLWMEGNDIDCANDVAGATITFNLQFTIV